MLSTKISLLKNIWIKIGAIILSCAYITILLLWQNGLFEPLESLPKLHKLDQRSKNKATGVETGLHINNFPTFSFLRNNFIIDGIVWFRFPSGSESLQTLEGFTLHNSLVQKSGDLLFKSEPIIKLIGSDVLACYHIQATFKSNPIYKRFPLSDHMLSIIIHNKKATPHELYFVSNENNLSLTKGRQFSSWQPLKKHVLTGYTKAMLRTNDPEMELSYPSVVFSLSFENIGIRDLISLYFPIFVLFFIALFSLLISITDTSRLSYVASAVPILVLFRMVINGQSPDIGYNTHIDLVYYTLIFLSLFILLFQTYIVLRLKHIEDYTQEEKVQIIKRLESLNDKMFFVNIIILIAAITYICFR